MPTGSPATTRRWSATPIKDPTAKNVILLIGDGMGDSEITIARNYAYGAAGELPGIDALPLTGSYTTYSIYKDGPNKGKPDYVPDSAATGTAWATGSKTYDNAVSVDIDGNVLPTLLEIAKANGLQHRRRLDLRDPGCDARRAGRPRRARGPATARTAPPAARTPSTSGGLGSISEQLLDTRPDVDARRRARELPADREGRRVERTDPARSRPTRAATRW